MRILGSLAFVAAILGSCYAYSLTSPQQFEENEVGHSVYVTYRSSTKDERVGNKFVLSNNDGGRYFCINNKSDKIRTLKVQLTTSRQKPMDSFVVLDPGEDFWIQTTTSGYIHTRWEAKIEIVKEE